MDLKGLRHPILAELRRPEGFVSGAPCSYKKEKKPMSWFSHGYHGYRYCSWARTYDDSDDGVAQHGGHTQNNRLTDIDIGHPCYDQLTPVKTSYHLSSITWPYYGLKLTKCCFLLDRGLRIALKPVNANPALKNQPNNFFFYTNFFAALFFV